MSFFTVSKCCELGIGWRRAVSRYGSGFVETDPGFFGVFGSEFRIQAQVDDQNLDKIIAVKETKSQISVVRELGLSHGTDC
jgi:hypothetical protein